MRNTGLGIETGESMQERHVDNLIIGAGLVGAVTARTLERRGERGILVERSADPGGVNGSFTDGLGNWFDHGRHIISHDRSSFTTEFVTDVLRGSLRRFDLKRGIVVRGHLIPYAATLAHWPEPLQRLIDLDPEARIGLGATRAEFARAYGRRWADLVFDEMMHAYPVLEWQRQRGVTEERLTRWLFPWFFPRSGVEEAPNTGDRAGVYSEESRRYHYECRHAEPPRETVLYPREGGFGRLVHAMLEDSQPDFDLYLGAEDIDIDVDPERLVVHSVTAGGGRYHADRVFWCAPLPVLCRYLGWRLPQGEPQWELLGSFTFEAPVDNGHHEILFADPAYPIRRINFPGLIAGGQRSQALQVEYTTLGDEARRDGGEWRSIWLASLRELGIVRADQEPVFFDFKRVSRGVVSTEDLGAFLKGCEQAIDRAQGNLVAPHLAVASDNNARLIPKVHRFVERVLSVNP